MKIRSKKITNRGIIDSHFNIDGTDEEVSLHFSYLVGLEVGTLCEAEHH